MDEDKSNEENVKSNKETHIWIDADACPVVRIVEKIAEKYTIPVTLLCDTNHVLESDYSEVIVVGAGADAVGSVRIGAEAENQRNGHQKMMNISASPLRK